MIGGLRRQVAEAGFARLAGTAMRELLGPVALASWNDYAESWNNLALDAFMADGGRYRRRRFGVFEAAPNVTTRQPHQPHYQGREYNVLNGGLERWFEPIDEAVANSSMTRALVDLSLDVFGGASPNPAFPWRTEMHQFRIEARAGEAGQPTPEGVHRDGVDWVLVVLVARRNIAAGATNIFSPGGASLGAFILTEPLDAVFIDDRRVLHGVTAIEPADPNLPAYRDVLVLTSRRQR